MPWLPFCNTVFGNKRRVKSVYLLMKLPVRIKKAGSRSVPKVSVFGNANRELLADRQRDALAVDLAREWSEDSPAIT
jgi:hypothetical protein